jgi:hypothetical protein
MICYIAKEWLLFYPSFVESWLHNACFEKALHLHTADFGYMLDLQSDGT